MESPISYVSLALSLTAFFLFIYNGFEDAETVHRDTRLVETSKVWHYNATSGVASLDENVKIACVGVSPEECERLGDENAANIVVSGGLMLGSGGPVLKGTGNGRVRLEDSFGNLLLLVNPATGAVLVGGNDADLPLAAGVRVVGNTVRGTHQDSENWAATDGFELFSPGATEAYGMVHRIVHKEDASIAGVRISPVVPVAAPERSLHVTPRGIVVGDATAAFIHANTGEGTGADVVVYGNAYIDSNSADSDFPTCTTVPVDLAELYDGTDVAWKAVRVTVESCSKLGGLTNAAVLDSGADFNTCQGNFIYFNDGTSKPLGQCTGDGEVYYCRAGVVVQS